MLSVFRRIIHSKFGAIFAILFLGVIAAAFILGDVTSGQFGGASLSGGGTAAKAKGYKLTVAELQDRVQRVFENARRSSPELQIGEFFAQGGGAQVFDQLVQSLTLRAFADDQGMHISKRLIDAQIAQVPAFQDAAGNFSNDSFRALLARERLSEQALRDDIRREILQRQLLAPIGLGARPSENLVLPYASLLLEARQGNVAAIPAVAFLDDKDPTDAQLTDFYKKNSARFTIPEQRRIRYAVVDATRFAQAAAPSDADISAYYNQNKADYAASQTRSVEQLVLPTEAQDTPAVWTWLQQMVAGNGPIRRLIPVDVRQSMANGGGPACLRLRVVADPATIDPRFLLDERKLDDIAGIVARYWPEEIAPDDLGDTRLIARIEQSWLTLVDHLQLSDDLLP